MLELELLQLALGTRSSLSRKPTAAEWQQLYQQAEEHSVIGLAFGGIERLGEAKLRDESLELREESGSECSECSEWEKACQLLEEKGVKLEYEVYKEVEFTQDGVYVECHRVITPVRGNKHLQKVERYLRSLLDSSETQYFEGTHLVNPPLMFTAMLWIEHALGDLLHGKMLLKHVVDWNVLRKQPINMKEVEARCKEFGFDRFLNLADTLADYVEGNIETLPLEYQEMYNVLLNPCMTSPEGKTWFRKRLDILVSIVKSKKMFRKYGYCSMASFLMNAMWTHFFDKEIKF